MNTHASYIYSAYSFINSISEDQLYKVGSLSVDGVPIPSFDEDLLIKLCKDAKRIFKNEENIIEIDGDSIIVGDIHGSLHDLLRIIQRIEKCNSKVIFLGDYVDRGCFSLECITLLFTLKILKPKSIFLLRGNHEFEDMCSNYGFKKEILNYHNPHKSVKTNTDKTNQINENKANFEFDSDSDDDDQKNNDDKLHEETYFANHVNINCHKYSEKLYDAFMKAFTYLPICAIVNKTSICIHGGLSPLLYKVESIQSQIKRPVTSFDENPLLCDIVWGDPLENLPEFYCDSNRGRGKLFSGPVVVNFLKNNNLKRLIRGHECVDEGIEELFNGKCITVFSASSYSSDMGNSSGILKIYKDGDKVEPIIFPPLKRLEKCDASYYKVQSFTFKMINRSSLPQISKFKNDLLIPLEHSIPSTFDMNRRYLSSSRKSTIMNFNQIPNLNNIVQMNPKAPKRLNRVFKYPHIRVPHVSKNENKIVF